MFPVFDVDVWFVFCICFFLFCHCQCSFYMGVCCWFILIWPSNWWFVCYWQFQTTAPKSCYMRPPGGILAPGESLIATGNLSASHLLFFFLSGSLYTPKSPLSLLISHSWTTTCRYHYGFMNSLFDFLPCSVQVCGTSREQWETSRPEEQG